MSKTPSSPPDATDIETRVLRSRLNSLSQEASHNEEVLRRFNHRELSLLGAETLPELLHSLTVGMQESFGLPDISAILYDPDHELRHLLLHNDRCISHFPNIRFVDGRKDAPAVVRDMTKPWLGPVQAEHEVLFPHGRGLQSVALIPMLRREQLVGSLHLGSNDPQRFTRHHASDFLHHLASIAAVCLENATNREHLVISGLTDALTGLHNRRYLERRIQEEIARAIRYQQPMSCLFVDADHFKLVNDQHGHSTGDTVLREIALRIRGCLRASDMATRFGGEEFALLLPQTDADESLHLAERIRHCIAGHTIPTCNNEELTVTVSVGVSRLDLQSDDEYGALGERLLHEADSALYKAKQAGRNCVRLFVG
jgi:diguanylate cyclase (GGDEF)-like protein